jgi:hypothetical protein
VAPRQLNETKHRATSSISQPEQASNCRDGHRTATVAEFDEDELPGQSPVAHGVKCHVSCDMARYGYAVGHRLFQQEETILFRLRAEACDSCWLVFVFVSGTVVAAIES